MAIFPLAPDQSLKQVISYDSSDVGQN